MASLNWPKLDLPAAQEVAAFRAIDRIIRQDPVCKRIFGKNFYSWTGDPLDTNDPTSESCPWIRLSPVPGASSWENVGQHRMPMSVAIELAVSGTRIDELLNLWGVVRAALFPQDLDQLAAVQAIIDTANITKGRMTRAAYAVSKDDKGVKILKATGDVELLLLINT